MRFNTGTSIRVFGKRNSFARVIKLGGQMPRTVGGHLETIWGYPDWEWSQPKGKQSQETDMVWSVDTAVAEALF